jgi:hypothetical protein
LGIEFDMPTFLVWSVSPVRALSAAATFPNENGLFCTIAEGKLCGGCGLGCCGGAGKSSVRCAISFCVQKRSIKIWTISGYFQSNRVTVKEKKGI